MITSLLSAEPARRAASREEVVLPLRRSYFSELIDALSLRDPGLPCTPILFTSPHSGAGVSFVSSYVATELATPGGRVLLADAQTLTALAGKSEKDAAKQAQRIDTSSLWVLGANQVERDLPLDKTSPCSGARVVAALREEFTHIIVDAPAISASEDAIRLGTAVHGIVLVAQAGRTTIQEMLKTRERLVSLGGRVLGSIYNARTAGVEKGDLV